MKPFSLTGRDRNRDFPFLSLPPQGDTPWMAETDLEKAERWIATLPVTDSANTARQLYEAIYTLNRIDLGAKDRLALVEVYRRPLATAVNGLRSNFSNLSLPLTPPLKQLADFIVQLHVEFAYAYKHVIEAARGQRKPWERAELLLAVERTCRYLGEALLSAYHLYMPAPSGIWREIHALYRYADGHDVVEAIIGREDTHSIGRRYRQILMLGLCGPYQLSQNECHRVNAFLGRWSDKVEIDRNVEDIDPTAKFLVDFDADHPAVSFPHDVPLRAEENLRTVNALELARTVYNFIQRLQKGEPPRALDLGFECVSGSCIDTLRRMMKFWGIASGRHFTRRRSPGIISLCVGVNAVHFFIDDQRPFAPVSSAPPVPGSRFMTGSARKTAVVPPAAHTRPEIFRIDNRWQVRDESAGGLSLMRSGEAGMPVRVGDLLGIQKPVVNQWRIGVVRWIKSPDVRQIEIGVEMLAPSAKALAARLAGAGGDETPFRQALLVPPIDILRQPATLIVQRDNCRPGQDMEILAAGERTPRRIRILKILERTGAFAQLVFADLTQTAGSVRRTSPKVRGA